ncbi:hypothetical protein NBRC116592_34870 [Colwellia sp. KU-HH00111]|uniref:Spy/CpxP family protein refolding chaperone n=1 Tax=Colwellia sp. KU-HH00111 TaxID=3127652 RepID=UPI00310A2243
MNLIKPMKTIATTSALCAVIALSSISSVNAASGGNTFDSPRYHQRGGDFGAKMQKRMIKKLDLSAEQQVQIDALKAQAKEQNQILRESMKKFKTEEKALLQAEAFDEQAYLALHAAYQSTFAQKALTKAKTKHAIFNVLTTEQQQQWLQLMEKRKAKMNNKRG